MVNSYSPAIGDKVSTLLGPPVCMSCMCSYTRNRRGWYCSICKAQLDDLQKQWFYHMLKPEQKQTIDQNDKFYNFMGKHKHD